MAYTDDLTWGELKQVAVDSFQDGTGEKSERQILRIVNNAARRVAKAKLWAWYRIGHRFMLRPPIDYTGVSIALGAVSATISGSTFDASADLFSFHILSGTQLPQLLRVQSRNSGGSVLTMFSTDQFVAESAAVNAAAQLTHDRVLLPVNFRSISSTPQEHNFFASLEEIDPSRMGFLKTQWETFNSDPRFYCLDRNPVTGRWEVQFWPAPSQRRSVAFYMHIWPAKFTTGSADADILDWDPSQVDVIHAAIRLECAYELQNVKRAQLFEKPYRQALLEAMGAERNIVAPQAAGDLEIHSATKLELARGGGLVSEA